MFRAGISIFAITGNSMYPDLESGDSIVLKQEKDLKEGQLIFFNKPKSWKSLTNEKHNKLLVKRVAAIPGDTLKFDGKGFIINNEKRFDLPDGYKCEAPIGFETVLKKRQIFVLGDNALHSNDSRAMFCKGKITSIFIDKRAVADYGHVLFRF